MNVRLKSWLEKQFSGFYLVPFVFYITFIFKCILSTQWTIFCNKDLKWEKKGIAHPTNTMITQYSISIASATEEKMPFSASLGSSLVILITQHTVSFLFLSIIGFTIFLFLLNSFYFSSHIYPHAFLNSKFVFLQSNVLFCTPN